MAGQVISKITAGDASINLVANSAYFYSSTATATVAKVAKFRTADQNAFVPIEGTTINVRFLYSNTATNPTLTLQTSGGTQVLAAKPIYRYGTTVPGTNAQQSWPANSIVSLTYDTTVNTSGCWIINNYKDGDTDTNTDTNVAQQNHTTSAIYPILFANNTTTSTTTGVAYKSVNITANPSTGIIGATNLNITSTLTAGNVNINASAITEGLLSPNRTFIYPVSDGVAVNDSETYIGTVTTAPTSYSNTGWTIVNLSGSTSAGSPIGVGIYLCWGVLKVTTTPNVKYGDYCYRNSADIYMRLPNVAEGAIQHISTLCSSPLGGSTAGNFYISFGGQRSVYKGTDSSPIYGIPFRVQTFGSFTSSTWYASVMIIVEAN